MKELLFSECDFQRVSDKLDGHYIFRLYKDIPSPAFILDFIQSVGSAERIKEIIPSVLYGSFNNQIRNIVSDITNRKEENIFTNGLHLYSLSILTAILEQKNNNNIDESRNHGFVPEHEILMVNIGIEKLLMQNEDLNGLNVDEVRITVQMAAYIFWYFVFINESYNYLVQDDQNTDGISVEGYETLLTVAMYLQRYKEELILSIGLIDKVKNNISLYNSLENYFKSEIGRKNVRKKFVPKDKRVKQWHSHIDKLIIEKKKHHQIANEIMKIKDSQGYYLHTYISGGVRREMQLTEIKNKVKKYLDSVGHSELVHGRR